MESRKMSIGVPVYFGFQLLCSVVDTGAQHQVSVRLNQVKSQIEAMQTADRDAAAFHLAQDLAKHQLPTDVLTQAVTNADTVMNKLEAERAELEKKQREDDKQREEDFLGE